MKNTLLTLVALCSLVYGQAAVPPPAPPAPAPNMQPIIEAGGLDARCQAGFNGHYHMNADGSFGANNPAESADLSRASTCVAYITGWAQTLSGAFIQEGENLWYVEISDSFNPVKMADDLHEFLKNNSGTRTVSSQLVLLKVAVDEGVARVTQVDFNKLPSQQDESASPTSTNTI